jgi:dolichyl-phosphate beta-glucosyltransferase
MKIKPMDFSIIIPAYEESAKIEADVKMAAEFLAGNDLHGEIIVVDDSSSDNTSQIAKAVEVPSGITLEVLRYEPHRGKGYAVRTGIAASTGDYVMFADSGCCVPFGNSLLGLEILKDGTADIANASRKHFASDILNDQPVHRRVCSNIIRWIIKILLGLPRGLTDTQCGFKVYKGDIARELYAQCISDGFMFDVEIILRAHKKGYRIAEFPIEWSCDPDTRLSVVRTPLPVLSELWAIKRAVRRM